VIFQLPAGRSSFSTSVLPLPGRLIFYNGALLAMMVQQSTFVMASTKHSNSDKSTKNQLVAKRN